jgi:acyl-CoA hydrolase
MLIVDTFATLTNEEKTRGEVYLTSRCFEVGIDGFAKALLEFLKELQAHRVRHFLGLIRSTTAAE